MPVCLTHNQQYDTSAGEHCIYCGRPAQDIGEVMAAAVSLATDGLPMSGYTLVTCPKCTVPVPSHAQHRCNMEILEMPEIKDEDIPPHERL